MTEAPDAAEQPLEIVLLELLLFTADVVGTDFQQLVLDAVDKVGGGTLLFNLRLDEDPRYQRCVAVQLVRPEDPVIALCFLDLAGQSISVECAHLSGHPLANDALALANAK